MVWSADELGDVGDQLVGAFQNPGILIGIPLALLGAVFMSFGAQYQHRGVTKVERLTGSSGSGGLQASHLLKLLARPSWVIGTLMLGLAIVCQLSALAFAPLIVVQPLGAIALVITTLLNAQISGHKPTKRSLIAIGACVGGIFVFVAIAALFATEKPVSDAELITILVLLAVVAIVFTGLWIWLRTRIGALFYIIAAGVLYGFVATLAKVVIERIKVQEFDWLTLVCVIALVVAAIVGAYFVQSAYASGPPDLVVAGLTVVDPIVAIIIGLTILQEAAGAPLWVFISFGVVGAIAVWGVFQLARHHPQVVSDSQELPIQRGSHGGSMDAAHPRTGSIKVTEAVSKVWPEPPVKDRADKGAAGRDGNGDHDDR
ncbi:DMT family transporter [Microbacterium sp. NPDC058389]|uniref:DMT family transporter n=1 Tax=Microbacterium sp. NPDC058389 TaxID=3346475 RepID=UPI00366514BC